MNFLYPIKIAFSNLLAAKIRSFLTILGIIIGVGAVIVIMAVGDSAQQLILDQVQGLGSNLVGVLPGASEQDGPPAQIMGIKIKTLKYADFEAIMQKSNVPEIQAGAAYVQGTQSVVYSDIDKSINIQGTTHQYPIVQEAEIDKGRFFYAGEDKNLAKVAVLGSKTKIDMFGTIDPIGKRIKIGKENFEVVGIFKEKGSAGFGTASQDDAVYVPLMTAQKILFGTDYLEFARFKVRNVKEIELAKRNIEHTMRIQHDIDDSENDDFTVRDMASAVKTITNITDVIKYFLALVAAISLVVGGIGIMNIMLISVNERVREVGLRKAIGAKNSHIIWQFLVETITITVVGGIIGIALGVLIAFLISSVINYLGYTWQFIINLSSIMMGIGVSVVVGLTFGIYPSRKASKISPMEALRYE